MARRHIIYNEKERNILNKNRDDEKNEHRTDSKN